jgi:hypothetical protein
VERHDVTSELENESDYSVPSSEGLALPPWEELQRYGFLNALYQTTKEVMLYPGRFFGRMPSRVGIWQPLLYAMVLGVIGAFFEWMWSLTGSTLQMLFSNDISELLHGPFTLGVAFILSPVLIFIHVFIGAGIIHLCLMLVGGNRLGFEATFRVIAYSLGTAVLLLIPFCGSIIFLFWGLVVVIIGVQKIHAIEAWRAVLAALIPLVVCTFGFAAASLTIIGFTSYF